MFLRIGHVFNVRFQNVKLFGVIVYNGMYGSSVLFWELALVDNKSVFLIS